MPALALVGAQWGDEGKGKIVDLLSPYADVVVRYGGGANAGHTLVVGDEQVIFHLIPSGALHPQTECVLGQGVVLDPAVLLSEMDQLAARGLLSHGRLRIAERAHVVLPHHRNIDALRDSGAGTAAIGTTRRGIGPVYEDKVARFGIRVADLFAADLKTRVAANLQRWTPELHSHGGRVPAPAEMTAALQEFGARIRPHVCDAGAYLHAQLEAGRKVLLEGAQGTLLDLDLGTYPFVTSSHVVAAGAAVGAGIAPTWLDPGIGIAKAYTTRVGAGPFPTELDAAAGTALRQAGAEFGTTTGRPRRCGWLDIPALRLAVRANGLRGLALTKLDVLSGLPELQLCVAYERAGERLTLPPARDLDAVTPVYERVPGWQEDIGQCADRSALPIAAQRYIDRIAQLVGCPVELISVGPERAQTLDVHDPFIAPRERHA